MQENENKNSLIPSIKQDGSNSVPFIFEKLMDIKGNVMTIENNISDITKSLSIAQNSLDDATSAMINVAGIYSDLTGLTRQEVLKIVDLRWQEEGTINYPNRYWREKNFEGWRIQIIKIITEQDRLMTLNDLIDTTGEENQVERKRLESAMSNALSTGVKSGIFMYTNVTILRGRLYGLPKFFDNGTLKYIYANELINRYNVDGFAIVDGNE
jgi:hypothetical protein